MNLNKIKKTIAIILPDLGGGGAERMRIYLAREFIKNGYRVDFVLFSKRGDLLPIAPKEARIVDLKVDKLRKGLSPLIKYLKQEKPDAILAAMWPLTVMSVWARMFSGLKSTLVVSEHIALSGTPVFRKSFNHYLMPLTMWLSFRNADSVVGVSNGVVADIKEISRSKKASFSTIYNPTCPDSAFLNSIEADFKFWNSEKSKKIIAVGRLKKEKDYPTLLNAFKMVSEKIDVELLILGEGPRRQYIEGVIDELGLNTIVHMPGFVPSPFPFLKSSDLFVMSSTSEGLPNVVIEALATGTPVVSTNCKSGPDEILENGKYGTLVPVGDVEALAKAIIESLQKDHDPAPLIERAKFFSPERIAKQYLELLFPNKSV